MSAPFTPYRIDSVNEAMVVVAIKLRRCGVCNHDMVSNTSDELRSVLERAGPYWLRENRISAQLARAGLRLESRASESLQAVCQECWQASRLKFHCYLCGVDRPADQLHVSFGYDEDVDHLCTVCYDHVSARRWEETVQKLVKSHTNVGVY